MAMTEIEHKVQVIRQYIYNNKGVDIIDINLEDHNDIAKLDWAYNYIMNKRGR